MQRIIAPAAALALTLLTACAPQEPPIAEDPIPRMADGRPDLRGIWQTLGSAVWNLEDHPAELGVPAGQSVIEGGSIPYLPAALAQRQQNLENRLTEDPEANCYMVGVPRITYMPYPFQIMQTPDQVTILYEYVHIFRNIYIDSEHPPGPIQWWMGDSRAHWEGDTLVVDVIHFTDRTWLDRSGNFHSSDLHVVERYTPTGPDHLWYEATIEDPKVFSQPWKIALPLYRRKDPNMQILEYECYAYTEALKDADDNQ
jgi:hypothetical protein